MLTDAPEIWSPDPEDSRDITVILAAMADSIHQAIARVYSSGAVMAFAGDSAPEGWILCRGQAVSRLQFGSLFETIGEKYGAGDGSTTFNVPNLRGRVIVGWHSGDTDFNESAKTGGEKSHTLTVDEMPAHGHRISGGDTGETRLRSGRAYLVDGGAGAAAWAAWFGEGYNSIHNVTATDTGGNQSHNNMPPYIVMNYIIKA